MTATDLTVLKVFVGPDGRGGNPLGVFLDGAAVQPGVRRRMVVEVLAVVDRRLLELGDGLERAHQFTQVMIGSHCSRSPWNRVEATSQSVNPCAARWT